MTLSPNSRIDFSISSCGNPIEARQDVLFFDLLARYN
jgi:hypothetical protein